MQTAYGIISPNIKTAVTDIRTAQAEGTIESKNIGRASIAVAFARSNVTIRK